MISKHNPFIAIFTLVLVFNVLFPQPSAQTQNMTSHIEIPDGDRKRFDELLQWVFDTMNREYYIPPSQAVFDQFIQDYPIEKVYEINARNKKVDDYVYLGAGLLVFKLRDKNDRFSTFFPPVQAVEFKQEAYAAKKDLGLKGQKNERGYQLTKVQLHSDAYLKGVRSGDVILEINQKSILDFSEAEITVLLNPEVATWTKLKLNLQSSGITEIDLQSKSYFIETVNFSETIIPGVVVFGIEHFNQKTSQDLLFYMEDYGIDKIEHMVIDLRNNKGGPPLATREILGFFTKPLDPLFFIIRRNRRPMLMQSPNSDVLYSGGMTVLVNDMTASAAETLSGVLREKNIADMIGQKTNGACYLKSMYDYSDGSTMMLVTSQTFFHNERVFPPNGLTPDILLPADSNALDYTISNLTKTLK
ncbi:MAG: C-terminal peptidase prc [Candidatus Omnitrophota bacterium]|jgi:C-terminal peptidase prc